MFTINGVGIDEVTRIKNRVMPKHKWIVEHHQNDYVAVNIEDAMILIREITTLTSQLAAERRAVERLINGILSLNDDCPPVDCPSLRNCRDNGKDDCWRDYAYAEKEADK
jgi:hypothetical protein